MTTISTNWDSSWTATSIASSTVTNTSTATTAAISNDGKSGSEVSVTIAYGGTVNQGVKVYILRDIDGTNYEAVTDKPWGFEMPSSVSTTYRRAFAVCADRISNFKVHVTNDSGASVTATVKTRQATIDAV
jgi:hypothetical protein